MQIATEEVLRPTLALVIVLAVITAILGLRAWRSLITPSDLRRATDWPSFLRASGAVQTAAGTVGMLVAAVAAMYAPSLSGVFRDAVLTDVSRDLKLGPSVTIVDTKGAQTVTISAHVEGKTKSAATLLITDAASKERVLGTLRLDVGSDKWSTWRGTPLSSSLQLVLVPLDAADAKVRMIAVAER